MFFGLFFFSFQFRNIIILYKRKGYNLNVMRQSECVVFNTIMDDNYAALFNCTPVGRAADSLMAPTIFWSFLSVAWATGVQLVFLFCSRGQ